MAVVVETTLGDITVDLFLKERPKACQNFLKLCKMKYYNYNLFHTVSRGFIAQTGDPTGTRNGGESIFGVLEGPLKRFFLAETNPKIKHTVMGLISFVGNEENMIGSQFFFTLGDELSYLDEKHCVFGQVTEGLDVLEIINEAICDSDDRPYQDIRITHTVILDDPLPDLERMIVPSRSPSPSAERLQGGRIAPDEEIDETAGKSLDEVNEIIAEREAKARAAILEMVGDIPDAEMAPPENVLFVCKLNPVTTEDDLEIIFSRFGKIKSCEVIKDHKTGDSLQYAFVEFTEQKACEDAYFKMDNVLIDDRRIHVDFSQSVSKVKWMGKGRGVKHFDEKNKTSKNNSSERYNNKNRNEDSNRRQNSRRCDYENERSRSNSSRNHRNDHRDRREERSNQRYRRDRSRSVERKNDRRRYDNSRSNDKKRDYKNSSPDRKRNERRSSRSPRRNHQRSRKRSSDSSPEYRRKGTRRRSSSSEDEKKKDDTKRSKQSEKLSKKKSRRSRSSSASSVEIKDKSRDKKNRH